MWPEVPRCAAVRRSLNPLVQSASQTSGQPNWSTRQESDLRLLFCRQLAYHLPTRAKLVRPEGLEPPRHSWQRILSPPCLPIPSTDALKIGACTIRPIAAAIEVRRQGRQPTALASKTWRACTESNRDTILRSDGSCALNDRLKYCTSWIRPPRSCQG